MKDYVAVTIVPKYNCVVETYNMLNEMGISVLKGFSNDVKRAVALTASVARDKISKLEELRSIVDLIAVYSVNKTELDKVYKSISSRDLKIEQDFVLYSPTAIKHPGKMSNSQKSDAKYYWVIPRDEPADKKNPVSLLLQFIKPNSSTSRHYHVRTIESFLPLFGKTIITCHRINEKLPAKAQNLIYSSFKKIMPKTAHQLKTLDGPAVNLICMRPYDPKLKDHFYEE